MEDIFVNPDINGAEWIMKLYEVYPITYVASFVLFFFCLSYINSISGFRWSIYPYSSGLCHWHWGNHMIAPVPVT